MGEQEDAEENLLEDDKETGENRQRQRRPREKMVKMSQESGRQTERRTRQRMKKKTQESNKQTQRRPRQRMQKMRHE